MTLLITVGLCAASSIAYAVGALLQRRFAARGVSAWLSTPQWWLAVVLNAAGGVLHVAALRFGPLLLVQPLGLLSLVLAIVLGAVEYRRRISPAEWRGLALTCGGLAGLLMLIDANSATALRPGQLPPLLAAVTGLLAVTGAARRKFGSASLWAAVAAGLAFGVASALAQTLTIALSANVTSILEPVNAAVAAATAVLAGVGLFFTQLSLRGHFGAALATSTLTDPIVAAAIGIALLGEGLHGGAIGVALGLGSAVLAAYGIVILSRASDQHAARRSAPGNEEAGQPVSSRTASGQP
jgi:drug/metabolite transporter (DMT)-like permease